MASTRLTKTMKDEIVRRVITKTFSDKNKEIDQLTMELADMIYNETYDQAEKDWMAKAPASDALIYRTKVYAYKLLESTSYIKLASAKPVFPNRSFSFSNEEVKKKAAVINRLYNRYEAEKSELRSKVRGLLNSATTVNKLLELWPEAAEYFDLPNVVDNLPAVRAEELNSAIKALKGDK